MYDRPAFTDFLLQIPNFLLTRELCDELISKYPSIITEIPFTDDTNFLLKELCKSVVRIHQHSLLTLKLKSDHRLLLSILRDDTWSNDMKISYLRWRILYLRGGIFENLWIIEDLEDLRLIRGYIIHNDIFKNIPLYVIKQFDLKVFEGLIITGSQFNKYFGHYNFYKVTSDTEYHNNFQFTTGLNVDTKPFELFRDCVSGIYFSNDPHQSFNYYIKLSNKYFIRSVTVPSEAIIMIEGNSKNIKVKANRVILGERMTFDAPLNRE